MTAVASGGGVEAGMLATVAERAELRDPGRDIRDVV
jgi:hypothetical protein